MKIQAIQAAIVALSASFSLSAQDLMIVKMNDNTIREFSMDNIRSVTFRAIGISCPDDNHPHAIDLGLQSGTKWACCNIGTTAPEEYGDYYAWGETWTKDAYTEKSYSYSVYKWYGSYEYIDIGDEIAGTQYDVAHVKWGGLWQMPSSEQIDELMSDCFWDQVVYHGVNGMIVTGPNGKALFLPAAGSSGESGIYGKGKNGEYWSSSLTGSQYSISFAKTIYFTEDKVISTNGSLRFSGLTVRAVCR